jgi:hypothetical protein
MPTATMVVSSARFDQGLSYGDFLAGATVNRDKFEQNYGNPVLTEEDLLFFRKVSELPNGPRKLVWSRYSTGLKRRGLQPRPVSSDCLLHRLDKAYNPAFP